MADDQQPFQFEMMEPFYKRPRFVVFSILIAVVVVLFLLLFKKNILSTMSTEEVGRSLQIVWHESRWVDKYIRPDEAIIVPSFTFKVKNVGTKALRHVPFQGVFVFEENNETLSDGYIIALKKRLNPGETSDEIFLRAGYGYKATSKEAFIRNITEWKRVKVRMFARAGGSGYALLGVYPVKHEIEGIQVVFSPETPANPE